MPAKFSLVIPTHNEAANISDLCQRLIGILKEQHLEFEIIIVDDDSRDGTKEIVENLAQQEQRIKLLSRLGQRGLATAVAFGWNNSEGEILGVIDGDLQHPPETLVSMLKSINENEDVDIVVASRYINKDGLLSLNTHRKFISRLATFLSSFLIPGGRNVIQDPMSGYFIMRKEVIHSRKLYPMGYKILVEILVRGNYRKVFEVPYVFEERIKGGSKAGIKQYFISLFHFIKLGISRLK